MFVSPAHGELFDADGRLWDGPAARGLDRYASEVIHDLAVVHTQRVIEGGPRRDDANAAGLLQGQAMRGLPQLAVAREFLSRLCQNANGPRLVETS